ncbi:tRNA preQ1(34) S-adenosylmethionine ribosyltransferase-isomerase QueA [Candidatus Poriferisocius sp.]|uniref:tRNA preQ1(34) S-adenosylmethionine ribosyltransferase-isomerase QueA n=1 Tax=Candidatus Poriferisocius sp. TaxID=3101276 RepID=UPI003B029C4F
MQTEELDYQLPEAAIAQQVAEPRDSSRLLVDRGSGVAPEHRLTRDLPELLGPGDVLVVNDSRVMACRLRLRKATGGRVEVLLLEPGPDGWWSALVRPGRRVPPGTELWHGGQPVMEVGKRLGNDGHRRVKPTGDPNALMRSAGEVPLPPYITGRAFDPERYQTVYARRPVSAAAPTAGLHLTGAVLDRCRAAGAVVCSLELAVGAATFTPVKTDQLDDHPMHAESYRIPAATMAACASAKRVVAVGTTVVRALESAAATGAPCGTTRLFIRPGHRFEAVDALLTNFHLPRSSLLALLAAFIGPRWKDLYSIALTEGYRFLSLGDAMFCSRDRDRHQGSR